MRRAIAPLAAVTLLLTGCVGLPDTGSVQRGEVQEGTGPGDVEFFPEPPAPGATQEQIVQGFLQAAISAADDFGTARQYLAGDVATTWDPTASVTLRSGQPQLAIPADGRVDATFDVVGRVDEHGALTATAEDATRRTFELVQEAGEWRIAAAPDGVVLPRFTFELLFDPVELAWFAEDRATLVPDLRWFAGSDDDRALDDVVDAVLDGPVPWLEDAVWSAADAQAVRVGDVRREGEVVTATVSFDQIEQDSSTVRVAQLALQIQRALVSQGVQEVVVVVDEAAGYAVSSADAPSAALPPLDARPLVLADGGLQRVGPGAPFAADVGVDLGALLDDGDDLALDEAAGVAVARIGGDVVRLAAGEEPATLDEGVAVAPSLDRHGWAWWVPDAAVPEIRVSDGTDERTIVLPQLPGEIRAIEVARDGARLAVVAETPGGTGAWTMGIPRDGGAPTGLDAPLRLPDVAGEPVDVAWADGTSIGVLTEAEDGTTPVVVLRIGGLTQSLETPQTSLEQIVGGTGGSVLLRARTAEGDLLAARGSSWQREDDVEDVARIVTTL